MRFVWVHVISDSNKLQMSVKCCTDPEARYHIQNPDPEKDGNVVSGFLLFGHRNVNKNIFGMFLFTLQDGSEYSATVVNFEMCVLDLGYGSEIWVVDLCTETKCFKRAKVPFLRFNT